MISGIMLARACFNMAVSLSAVLSYVVKKTIISVVVRRAIFAFITGNMTKKSGRASKNGSRAKSRCKPKHTNNQPATRAQKSGQPTSSVAFQDPEVTMTEGRSTTCDDSTASAQIHQQPAAASNSFEADANAKNSLRDFSSLAHATEMVLSQLSSAAVRKIQARNKMIAETKDLAQDEIRAQRELRRARMRTMSGTQKNKPPAQTPETDMLASDEQKTAARNDSSTAGPLKQKQPSGNRRGSTEKEASEIDVQHQGNTARAPSTSVTPIQTQNLAASQIPSSGNLVSVKPTRKRASGRHRRKSSANLDTSAGDLTSSVNTGGGPVPAGLPDFPFQHIFEPRGDRRMTRPLAIGGTATLWTHGNSRLRQRETVPELDKPVCFTSVILGVLFLHLAQCVVPYCCSHVFAALVFIVFPS